MTSCAATACETVSTMTHSAGFSDQLKRIHQRIRHQYPCVSCADVVLQDRVTQSLKLFSNLEACRIGAFVRFPFYKRDNVPALTQEPEVINDLSRIVSNQEEASHFIELSGFQSGVIVPLISGRQCGFVFFSATEKDYFTPEKIQQMRVYTQLISQLVATEQGTAENLCSAVSTILRLNHVNQSECPGHLRRVAHYSRLIARNCKERFSLDKEWIEHLYLFAPLHDIGKAFVPEELLKKPGSFTVEEFELMKTHTLRGREIIDDMIKSFGYDYEIYYPDMLRNIIAYHHEAIDGSGYPLGLKGVEIPLEARIVAVADVLDALMTKRVYKEAWPIDKAFAKLCNLAGSKLDMELVHIITSRKKQVFEIKEKYLAF